jgi:RNA polymerase sigma-70 factor (ECF subfamily)
MDAQEQKLISLSQSGNRNAFGALHAAYACRVRAYFRRMGSTEVDAEDLVQDTFVRAFKSIGTFAPERGEFMAWLGAIARNVARRRAGRSPNPDLFDPELAEAVFVAQDDPVAQSQAREEAISVGDCVDSLPAQLALILRLRYVEARTTRGVSSVMDIPETTVRLRLKQAQDMVRRCLEEKGILD